MNSTSLDKITVKQICETADINRSTFYAHYSNPIELYQLLEREMAEKIYGHFEGYKNRIVSYMDFLLHMLECFYDNSELFLALYKTDSVSLKNNILHLIEIHEFLDKTIPKADKTYVFDYYINGIFSVITRWLREDNTKSIVEMAKLIYRLTYRPAQT